MWKTQRARERASSVSVLPEFECMWVGSELKSVSSVVTQHCYLGSVECKRQALVALSGNQNHCKGVYLKTEIG